MDNDAPPAATIKPHEPGFFLLLHCPRGGSRCVLRLASVLPQNEGGVLGLPASRAVPINPLDQRSLSLGLDRVTVDDHA
jgi:hypothetical protein